MCYLFCTALVQSDDLKAVISEMDKAFNYSQKVIFHSISGDGESPSPQKKKEENSYSS